MDRISVTLPDEMIIRLSDEVEESYDNRSEAVRDLDERVAPGESDIVVCTIHASKGREADDVVLFDGVTSKIETGIADNDEKRANEHRTWYVALTRASETLHIVRDSFRWLNEFLPPRLDNGVPARSTDDQPTLAGAGD